jgi:hypothetical protein
MLKFSERAVQSYGEYIVGLKKTDDALHPTLSLDDVFDDQVVSCIGEGRQGHVEAGEKLWSHVLPAEVAAVDPVLGKDSRCKEVIDRVVPEGLIQYCLKCCGKSGLAGA